MEVGLFSFFNDQYSGGRIHAWFIAEGLANKGHGVTIVTNQEPLFVQDFVPYPGHFRIRVKTLDKFFTPLLLDHFDVIIVVPDQCGNFRYYFNVLEFSRRIASKLVLVNFETPNWKREVGNYSIDSTIENGAWEISQYADMILSSTKLSREYAEKYFSEAKGGTKFEFCYPPIHSLIADRVTVSEREDRICIISRFYPRHKNSHRICEVLCEEMAGVEVVLIDGANGIDRNTEWYFTQACHRYNARFRYEPCVTEEEKFALLKSAKLTIFPSVFEGFGLPPVESLYCGTPCVAFDLPVLREVNGDGVVYARKEDFDDLRSKVIDVLRRVDGGGVPGEKTKYKGLFGDFSNRIDDVIQKVL